MTASISLGTASEQPVTYGRLPGLTALIRKDVREWTRGRRAWIVLAITTAFMVLTAANGWINAQIAGMVPPDVAPPTFTLSPVDNLLAAVGAQVYVLAAILGVVSLIVTERQSGTLAWTASKPVSRTAIWLSKWLSASAMLVLTAVVVPFAVTVGIAVALYGAPPVEIVLGAVVGMTGIVVFFAALGLAAGTAMPGQAAIAATGFGVFALLPVVASLIPLPITPYLPTSILGWSLEVAGGAPVPWVTPFAFAGWLALLVGVAIRQMNRLEL